MYDTPYSIQTSEAEIQTEMIEKSKDVHIQTENPAENPDYESTITVYEMTMAEEEIKQLKNENESMVQELTKLKAENQRVNERLEKEIKNSERLVESLDSVRDENLLKSSGNADLITKNNRLSKIVTDNEIEQAMT